MKAFASELEEMIIENLGDGLMFIIADVKHQWDDEHPEVPFEDVFTELFSQNKVGMANKVFAELRDTSRTD